ncbi:unnamed protein product [Scytosiphon promiscuus]
MNYQKLLNGGILHFLKLALISISLFLSQAAFSQVGAFKMEAEEMTLSGGFIVENGGFACEGSFIG